MNKIIAVDFDNTIAKTNFPDIIAPIHNTIDVLRKCKENGCTIILWTCRCGPELDAAVKWSSNNNVPIDLINENTPDSIRFFGSDTRKIYADFYIDDKSFTPDNLDSLLCDDKCNSCFFRSSGSCAMFNGIKTVKSAACPFFVKKI